MARYRTEVCLVGREPIVITGAADSDFPAFKRWIEGGEPWLFLTGESGARLLISRAHVISVMCTATEEAP